MSARPRRCSGAQWIFASTRNILIAVALFIALPTLVVSELALRASSDLGVAAVAATERAIDMTLLALLALGSVVLARHVRLGASQRERLRAVQAMAGLGGWEWDIWQDQISVSLEVLGIYGLAPGEGRTTFEGVIQRIHPDDRARVEREIKRVLREGRDLSIRHRIVRPDGSVRILETRGAATGPSGRPTGMRGTTQDVTDMIKTEDERSRLTALVDRTEAELAHRASHDALTGLPNRFLLQDRLDQATRAAQRSARPLAVLALDLDRFREINEAFSEAIGDAVLSEVSARLLEVARAIDTVARLSSDKFAVLVPEADREAAIHVAERLRAAVQRPIALAGRELSVDLSVGIAMYPEHGEDATTLVRRADNAMSVAKRTATGTFVYSTDLDQGARDRATLVTELRRAIEEDQLVIHYQPLVNLASGLILGAEALVRWQHPTRGLLGPGEFVPLAEQTSLMGALTRHILTKALRQYRRWHDAGHALPVLVNISPRDLRDPSFVGTIEALHDTYRVSPKWLKLEITEGFVVDDPERAITTLQRMRELGILIALDDFGTGYSSLSYLARLPVDAVKIDRSFVHAMLSDARNAAIVRATIGLAHTLGFGTVAEGVEDAATLTMLKEMGSDMAQGYHIARPMPANEFDRWLSTAAWRPRPAPVDTAGPAWSASSTVAVAA